MNNDIKEILDKLKDTADTSFFAISGTKEELENMPKCVSKRLAITDKQAKLLLDYITNLQQENERLKLELSGYRKAILRDDKLLGLQQRIEYLERSNNRREDTIIGLRDEIVEFEDYKSRVEKAVEYIEYNRNKLLLSLPPREALDINVLLNILNGDKSE